MLGGYRATRKNRNLLKRYKKGESIGFTAVASLKAKGLIPRTSRKLRGKKVLGPKYRQLQYIMACPCAKRGGGRSSRTRKNRNRKNRSRKNRN